jgi:hypothetical protein
MQLDLNAPQSTKDRELTPPCRGSALLLKIDFFSSCPLLKPRLMEFLRAKFGLYHQCALGS